MIIAIASGKGGTGKTSLSVALAQSVPGKIQLLDCDVEEPNSSIFIKPDNMAIHNVNVKIPVVNQDLCTGCGECSRMCQFNAIISLGKSAMVFPELCHSCGGCEMVCPTHAITETNHKIGIVRKGTKNNIAFSEGLLDIGNAMSPPVIREVKKAVKNSFDLTIIDCPPGTSCPMNEGVKKADFVILVTEPTPFGLYDLNMAVETIKILKIPFAVAINRFDSGDDRVEKYCRKENIKILIKIPDNRKAAEAYSNGNSLISAMPWLKGEFNKIIDTIKADLAAAGRKK